MYTEDASHFGVKYFITLTTGYKVYHGILTERARLRSFITGVKRKNWRRQTNFNCFCVNNHAICFSFPKQQVNSFDNP